MDGRGLDFLARDDDRNLEGCFLLERRDRGRQALARGRALFVVLVGLVFDVGDLEGGKGRHFGT